MLLNMLYDCCDCGYSTYMHAAPLLRLPYRTTYSTDSKKTRDDDDKNRSGATSKLFFAVPHEYNFGHIAEIGTGIIAVNNF